MDNILQRDSSVLPVAAVMNELPCEAVCPRAWGHYAKQVFYLAFYPALAIMTETLCTQYLDM